MNSGAARALGYPIAVTVAALALCAVIAPFADADQLAALGVVALAILGYTGLRIGTALGTLPNGLETGPDASTSSESTTTGPTAVEPTPAEPTPAEPTPAGLDSVEPTSVEPTSAGSTSAESSPAESSPAESSPAAARAVSVRRVRSQHRLVSRSWLELNEHGTETGRVTRWLPVYFDPALLALTESRAEVGAGAVTVGGVRLYPSGRPRATEPPGVLVDNPSRPDPRSATRAVTVTRPARRLLLDAQSTVAAPFAGLLWVYVADGGFGAFAGATVVAAAAAVWLAAVRGSDPS